MRAADAPWHVDISRQRVIQMRILSDQDSVLITWNDPMPELRLISRSEDSPEKVVYFLTGAIQACGGMMLSRRFHSDGSAAIECEFPRCICMDMYSVLLSAGLRLSRSSHLKLAELCRCTYALPPDFQQQIVVLEIEVLQQRTEEDVLSLAVERQSVA
jgi:hypothetical protein